MTDDPKQNRPPAGTPEDKPTVRPATEPGAAKPPAPLSERLRALGNPGTGAGRETKHTMMGLSPIKLPAQAAKDGEETVESARPPTGVPVPPPPRRSSSPGIGSGFAPPTAHMSGVSGLGSLAAKPAKPAMPTLPKPLGQDDDGWDEGVPTTVSPEPSGVFGRPLAPAPAKPSTPTAPERKSTMFGMHPQTEAPKKSAPVSVQPTPKPKPTPTSSAAASSPKFDVDVDDDFSRQEPYWEGMPPSAPGTKSTPSTGPKASAAEAAGSAASAADIVVRADNSGMLAPFRQPSFDWREKLGNARMFVASSWNRLPNARTFVVSTWDRLGNARTFVASSWDRLRNALPKPVARYLPHAGIFLVGLFLGALIFGGGDHDGAASAPLHKASIVPCADCGAVAKAAPGKSDEPAALMAVVAKDDEGTLALGDGECMIVLTSVPNGASVTVDGSRAGETPVDLQGLSCGQPVTVALTRDGHVSFRKSYTLDDGETKKIRVPLHRKRVDVKISSDPPGAKVKIGRKTVGKTPLKTRVVIDQRARIKVTLYGYQVAKKTIVPREGKSITLSVKLKKSKRGFLRRATRKSDD